MCTKLFEHYEDRGIHEHIRIVTNIKRKISRKCLLVPCGLRMKELTIKQSEKELLYNLEK